MDSLMRCICRLGAPLATKAALSAGAGIAFGSNAEGAAGSLLGIRTGLSIATCGMVPLHVEKGVFGGVERSGAKFVHLNDPL